MKIAVWCTGHPICDTVAKSLVRGLNAKSIHVTDLTDDLINTYDCHIAYGILRGTAQVFKSAERLGRPWFNVDNGYFNPGHFNGNYRISYRCTQARWVGPKHSVALVPEALTLIVPPTPDVCKFYDIDIASWLNRAIKRYPNHITRFKSDLSPINWESISQVMTFNSSLGWLALSRGIPCRSDPTYSTVGTFFVDGPQDDVHSNAETLFEFMRQNQLTLRAIEDGAAWDLIKRFMSI